MITDERLKWLSGPDYAKSEPGQIAAELLTARARIAALEAALLKIDLLGFGPCSMIVRGVMAAAETPVNPTMQHAPDCPILHGKECLCDPYPITSDRKEDQSTKEI